jgi:hypothetical protein
MPQTRNACCIFKVITGRMKRWENYIMVQLKEIERGIN